MSYRRSVAECCVERLLVGVEEVLDISETLYLELLRLLLYHLPVKYNQHCTMSSSCILSCTNIEKQMHVCDLKYLCRAEKRLLGLKRTGPIGSIVPLSLTQLR